LLYYVALLAVPERLSIYIFCYGRFQPGTVLRAGGYAAARLASDRTLGSIFFQKAATTKLLKLRARVILYLPAGKGIP
jgi:hypothetical protein